MNFHFDIHMNFHFDIRIYDERHSETGTKKALLDISRRLRQIEEKVDFMSQAQEEFDARISRALTAIEGTVTAIEAETEQVAAFIAANPSVDTSSLEGVVTRLETLSDSVGTIFEVPTEEVEEEPTV